MIMVTNGVRRIRLIVLIAAFVATSLGNPQHSAKWVPNTKLDTPETLRPDRGELSLDDIVSCAGAFLTQIGLRANSDLPRLHRVNSGNVRYASYTVNYPNFVHLLVRSTDGKVMQFYNTIRLDELSTGKRKNVPVRYKTKLDAQIYAHKIGKILGISNSHELTKLRYHGTGNPNDPETNNAPQAEVMFERKPYGYKLERWFDAHEFRIDLTDGAILTYNYTSNREYSIESKTATLTYSQAKVKAEPIARKFYVGRCSPNEFQFRAGISPQPSSKPSELMFVCPNGVFGGLDYDPVKAIKTRTKQRLRLAWVLRYPLADQIWIDAADGRLLGGRYHLGAD